MEDLEDRYEAQRRVEDAAERAARRIIECGLHGACGLVSLPLNRPPYSLTFPRVEHVAEGMYRAKELTPDKLNLMALSLREAVTRVIVEEFLR